MNTIDNIRCLQIEPTTYCNFKCRFCAGRYLEKEILSLESFQKILEYYPSTQYIELQGEGEPFLNPELWEMITCASHKGIKISTITNGSLLLNMDLKKLILSGVYNINISMESTNPDRFMFYRGGNLHMIIDGIKKLLQERANLKSETPSVGFSVTIMKDEAENFNEILSLYRELELDGGIELQFLNQTENYTKYYDNYLLNQLLSKEDVNRFMDKYGFDISNVNDSKSKKNYYDRLYECKREDMMLYGYSMNCKLLSNSLYIDCIGNVSRCVMIKNPKENSFGNIRDDSREEIEYKRQKLLFEVGCGIEKNYCTKCVNCIEIRNQLENILNFDKNYYCKIKHFEFNLANYLCEYIEEKFYIKAKDLYNNILYFFYKGSSVKSVVDKLYNFYNFNDSEVKYVLTSIIYELVIKGILI